MNKYNPNIHHRRSVRIKGYDYSQAGMYFITICVQNRECLYGEITNGQMLLNDAGKMIETEWLNLKKRFANIEIHEYTIMPNHFHAILEITETNNKPVGATLVVAQNNGNEINSHENTGQPQGIDPTVTENKTIGDMMENCLVLKKVDI
jgi:hypothetical protein